MILDKQKSIITNEDFLHTEGTKLVTPAGNQVQLRGTNLGGWLIQEAWMCPLDKEDKGWGSWDTLQALKKQGFSSEQILTLMNVYEDNWITEKDLDNIKDLRMNCVRVPFWYGNFQMDDVGTYYSEGNMDENPGFKRLDWVIKECGKRGIYVILDLHGAPGFQSNDHSCGKSHSSQLFQENETGKTYRRLTTELWLRIAKRYAGNPIVAAYDLLNEPMNEFAEADKKDPVLWELYNELYKAIRAVDPDHILTMEGIWEMCNLPDPASYHWKNVLYQTHNYNWEEPQIDQKLLDIKERADWNVPIYVGEFQATGIWNYTLEAYNTNEINWTTWTYKGTKSILEGWFIYRNPYAPVVNPEEDSYETIQAKWSMIATISEGFIKDVALAQILSNYCNVM